MSHGLLLMLENIDRRKNEIVPIDSNLDSEILQDHHKQLMVRCVKSGSLWIFLAVIHFIYRKEMGGNFFTFCNIVSNVLFVYSFWFPIFVK